MENHMKDFLQDLVAHTHSLGFLPIIKVSATATETKIESIAEDRSVILFGSTHTPVDDFEGIFGMPNLNKLDLHLKCPEYAEGATIKLVTQQHNDEDVPVGLHFSNNIGDFENHYRFMNQEIVNKQLKTVKFKGSTWDVEFAPTVSAIQRLKYQAAAHTEEKVFQVKTDGSNLIISFGDSSTHAGSFVFHGGITGKLKQTWSWPVNQVQSILALSGDVTIKIADAGALAITVDSGVAIYEYILPAQSK